MKNQEFYQRTVDIILDAYNRKKLEHGCPCGCFIGNIVAKTYNVKPNKTTFREFDYNPDWYQPIYEKKHPVYSKKPGSPVYGTHKEAFKQIASTGYTFEEILALETAFEDAYYLEEGTSQYEGMKAALNKLAEIHETKGEEAIEKLYKIQEKVYCNI